MIFKFVIGLNARIKYVIRLTNGIKPIRLSSKNFQNPIVFVMGFSFTVVKASCFDVKALPQVEQKVSVSLIGLLHTGQFIFSPL